LGLPWLIKENPDINWTKGHLQWRNAALTVIRDDTVKKGGNFPKIPYLFDQTLDSRDPFLISLIETFEEPTIPADESSLDILRIKISDHFNQIYGKPETKQSHQELVPKLYHQFIELFNKKTSERFPKPRPYDHEINLKPDFKPFKQAPYPLNPLQTKLAQDFIKENLDKGYIVKSKSPMASPLFFVGKKDGSYRPCQDYRKLNEGTVKDAFPLPNIQDLLRDLQGKQYFTKLDIRWGYNNIQIKPDHRWKAAFNTPFGLYEPTVMFFGLCNSPATFQRMMNHILWEEISEGWCKVYMDDILITADDLETLRKRTKQVLQILKTHDLYLKPEKCDFEKQQVDYLGFIIKPGEIAMDPSKLSGISDWPSPKTVKQVRSFLGFCNFYRRFIYRFSHMAKPLTELTKKGKLFEWTQECEDAFQLMKAQFLKAPVLRMPDPTQPLYLETDASLNEES
jgi:hypothetical protein